MFNVRPDQFWPWIHFDPPSDDPPGFRVAADGSMRAFVQSGFELPSDGSSPNPLEAFAADTATQIPAPPVALTDKQLAGI
jgi:hypothetical protein